MRIFVKILDNKLADRGFMLSELQQYNKVYHLFEPDEKLVLAVSGGVDSMVLTDLMQKAGAHFVVAHCNFHLRGEESDGDEQFVREYAEKNDLQCFVNHFDTEKYAAKKGVSIEMAARDLRYAWFEELRQQLGYDKIVLAHHADDQIETFFINLLRGAGLHGLKGMKSKNGVLIRPLLWASREQIRKYAIENQIVWREDHTNAEMVYLRNKIRNQLMPLMDEISVDARNSIGKSIGFLASENELYRQLLNEKFSQLVSVDGSVQSVEKSVFQCDNGFQLLFEWLRQYGFNTDQCRFVFEGLEDSVGKHFYSPSHQVTVERDSLHLSERKESYHDAFIIEKGVGQIENPLKIRFSKFEISGQFAVDKSPLVAMLDFDKIAFPLTLRHWRQGDRFHPLGMRGSKLLSDFFVSQKYTNYQKENQWLLVSANGDILWVVGQRIDDRYKVVKDTKTVFKAELW